MEQENRVVVLIDMDCFYCQVEEKLNPDLKGKPIAVVQYNPWKGGGIIAVNYVARAMGVTRHMRGDEAKRKCPEIELPSVPCLRGKADITKYRDAGKEVAKVLQKFTTLLERASIDEAYLDITSTVQQRLRTMNVNTIPKDIPNTFALGYDIIDEFIKDVHNCSSSSIEFDYEHAKLLLVGAIVVSEIRAAVYEETGYTCSAGIAHNKILAKLVCGMNKPNKQTVLPKHSINILFKTLPLKKVKHLGGKFGDTVCEILKISNMGELQTFSEKVLQTKFDDKNGTWLYNIARGIDLEPVQARFNPKSIGCCKQFRGKAALTDLESLKKWLKDLGDEIEDRLEKDALENNRTPKQMVVSFSTQLQGGRDTSSSRSYNFGADDELCGEFFSNKALELLLDSAEGIKAKDEERNRKLKANIKFLGISVGKFEDVSENKKTKKIEDYFGAGTSVIKNKTEPKEEAKNMKKNNQTESKEYMLKKYFQTEEKFQESKVRDPSKDKLSNEETLTSTLYNQESFFAKFINTNTKESSNNPMTKLTTEQIHPEANKVVTLPVCNIVECDNDSNDTDYSGSTIELEINKSIALFDDDPQDVERVSNIRQLLNNSAINNKEPESRLEHEENIIETDETHNVATNASRNTSSPQKTETFKCIECGKNLNISMAVTHADYHFALKLREEEREQVRNEKNNLKIFKKEAKINNHVTEQYSKNETSVASFFVKINDNVPTEMCSECGKKVPLEKYDVHLDFHHAQKLNRELNKRPISTEVKSSVKRKRKSISPIKKSKVPCKTIESFFR